MIPKGCHDLTNNYYGYPQFGGKADARPHHGSKNIPETYDISDDHMPPDEFVTSEFDAAVTTLDRSQDRALKESLMRRLAIIQGPPGTGKTFIGTKLVQCVVLDLGPVVPYT